MTEDINLIYIEVHLDPSQTSMMDSFANELKALTIFFKSSNLDVWLWSECVSDISSFTFSSSCSKLFYWTTVLKKIAIFTTKHHQASPILVKFQGWARYSIALHVLSCGFSKFFRTAFLWNTPRRLLLCCEWILHLLFNKIWWDVVFTSNLSLLVLHIFNCLKYGRTCLTLYRVKVWKIYLSILDIDF